MEKIKRYVTRKNLLLVTLIDGVIGLFMLLLFFMVANTDNFQSALSMLSFLCMIFYADFILLLLLTFGYGFLIFYMKQKDVTICIMTGCTAAAFLMSLLSFSAVHAVYQLLNGHFSAIWSLASSAANVDIWLLLMLILQLVCGVFSGYLRFVKKTEELTQEDLTQLQDTAKQVSDAAAATAKKAASDVAQGTAKLSEKWKAYAHTEKGKKTIKRFTIIGALIIVAALGLVLWLSARTSPIDLTSGCEVTFHGFDGEGYAYVDCDIDYDMDRAEIASFVYDVEHTVENDGKLSNGEKVILRAEYSEERAHELKLHVENAEKEIIVEGLTEVYPAFSDIPSDVSDQFAQASKEALSTQIMEDESWMFDPDHITINSCDNIGIYYAYNTYFGEGEAYYLYRVDLKEENDDRTENNIRYYTVYISPISSEHILDLSPGSNDITVSEIYLYDEEKTDAKAAERFSWYFDDVQTVQENFTDEVYKDTQTEKN